MTQIGTNKLRKPGVLKNKVVRGLRYAFFRLSGYPFSSFSFSFLCLTVCGYLFYVSFFSLIYFLLDFRVFLNRIRELKESLEVFINIVVIISRVYICASTVV